MIIASKPTCSAEEINSPFVKVDHPISVAVSNVWGWRDLRSGTGVPWPKRILMQPKAHEELLTQIPTPSRFGTAGLQETILKNHRCSPHPPDFQREHSRESGFRERQKLLQPPRGFVQLQHNGTNFSSGDLTPTYLNLQFDFEPPRKVLSGHRCRKLQLWCLTGCCPAAWLARPYQFP